MKLQLALLVWLALDPCSLALSMKAQKQVLSLANEEYLTAKQSSKTEQHEKHHNKQKTESGEEVGLTQKVKFEPTISVIIIITLSAKLFVAVKNYNKRRADLRKAISVMQTHVEDENCKTARYIFKMMRSVERHLEFLKSLLENTRIEDKESCLLAIKPPPPPPPPPPLEEDVPAPLLPHPIEDVEVPPPPAPEIDPIPHSRKGPLGLQVLAGADLGHYDLEDITDAAAEKVCNSYETNMKYIQIYSETLHYNSDDFFKKKCLTPLSTITDLEDPSYASSLRLFRNLATKGFIAMDNSRAEFEENRKSAVKIAGDDPDALKALISNGNVARLVFGGIQGLKEDDDGFSWGDFSDLTLVVTRLFDIIVSTFEYWDTKSLNERAKDAFIKLHKMRCEDLETALALAHDVRSTMLNFKVIMDVMAWHLKAFVFSENLKSRIRHAYFAFTSNEYIVDDPTVFCQTIANENGQRYCEFVLQLALHMMDPYADSDFQQKLIKTDNEDTTVSIADYLEMVTTVIRKRGEEFSRQIMESMRSAACDDLRFVHQSEFEESMEFLENFMGRSDSEKVFSSAFVEDELNPDVEGPEVPPPPPPIEALPVEELAEEIPSLEEIEAELDYCRLEDLALCAYLTIEDACINYRTWDNNMKTRFQKIKGKVSKKPYGYNRLTYDYEQFLTIYPRKPDFSTTSPETFSDVMVENMNSDLQTILTKLSEISLPIDGNEGPFIGVDDVHSEEPVEWSEWILKASMGHYMELNMIHPSESLFHEVVAPILHGCASFIENAKDLHKDTPLLKRFKCKNAQEAAAYMSSLYRDLLFGDMRYLGQVLVFDKRSEPGEHNLCNFKWDRALLSGKRGLDVLKDVYLPSLNREEHSIAESEVVLQNSFDARRREKYCSTENLQGPKEQCYNLLSDQSLTDTDFCKAIFAKLDDFNGVIDLYSVIRACFAALVSFWDKYVPAKLLSYNVVRGAYCASTGSADCSNALEVYSKNWDDKAFCAFAWADYPRHDELEEICISTLGSIETSADNRRMEIICRTMPSKECNENAGENTDSDEKFCSIISKGDEVSLENCMKGLGWIHYTVHPLALDPTMARNNDQLKSLEGSTEFRRRQHCILQTRMTQNACLKIQLNYLETELEGIKSDEGFCVASCEHVNRKQRKSLRHRFYAPNSCNQECVEKCMKNLGYRDYSEEYEEYNCNYADPNPATALDTICNNIVERFEEDDVSFDIIDLEDFDIEAPVEDTKLVKEVKCNRFTSTNIFARFDGITEVDKKLIEDAKTAGNAALP